MNPTSPILIFLLVSMLPKLAAGAGLNWQRPAQGPGALAVVNLTNDYTVRDWANYHNTQCWSPDGRYVCYTRYAADGRQFGLAPEIHLFDVQTATDRLIDHGDQPRWAHTRNWLFYIKTPRGGAAGADQAWWLDVDADRRVLVGTGLTRLGGVSYDERWIIGGMGRQGARLEIRAGSQPEVFPGLDNGSQWQPNPAHNVVFARWPNQDREAQAFSVTRYWFDIDGRNVRIGSEMLMRSHQAWLGNGEYYLMGNSQIRGRKWNRPFPSSIHLLAAVRTGDVSAGDRSGRYVVGDSPLTFADLRSGDGWTIMDDLSVICFPQETFDDSGPYDSDIKGSPDGTKIAFVSNYDLVNGPVTFITRTTADDAERVEVESTAGFPESGEIVVFREVIGYARKTPTSFEGLAHRKYGTSGFGGRPHSPLAAGRAVTLWLARLIPEAQWKTLPTPARGLLSSMGGQPEPLIRQKSTDVWLAQVRRPDRPWLRAAGERIELVPGEAHFETAGYHLYRDGMRVAGGPVRPGETRTLPAGKYAAVAVEWSGLESAPSNAVPVSGSRVLRVHREPPAGFSWTWDRWMVEGRQVERAAAMQSARAEKEVHHRYDGVIAREWYAWGMLQARHDLNAAGKAIRRQAWHQGRLFRREYHNRAGEHVSTEFFDPEGNVSELITYRHADGRKREVDRWWYDRGMPERRISAGWVDGARAVMWIRSGDKWVKAEYVGEIVPEHDALGEQDAVLRAQARQ